MYSIKNVLPHLGRELCRDFTGNEPGLYRWLTINIFPGGRDIYPGVKHSNIPGGTGNEPGLTRQCNTFKCYIPG